MRTAIRSREEIDSGIEERRERHRRRPGIVRVVIGGVGLALTAVGLPLAILLPELGLPVAAAGLGLLALEFDWAARALASVLRLSGRTRGWWRRRSRRAKAVAYATLAVVVGLAAIGTVQLLTA